MNALDKAFLRAYNKDRAVEPTSPASGTAATATKIAKPFFMKRPTITISHSPAPEAVEKPAVASNTDEVIRIDKSASSAAVEEPAKKTSQSKWLADGTWIRVEQATPREGEAIPAPHVFFATTQLSDASVESILAEAHLFDLNSQASQSSLDDVAPQEEFTNTRLDAASKQAVPKPHFRLKPAASPISQPIEEEIKLAPVAEIAPIAAPLNEIENEAGEEAAETVARAAEFAEETSDAHDRIQLISSANVAKPKLNAVWEVDRFLWSAACERALDPASDFFREAGSELHKATRNGLNILGITSSQRGEGRTMLSQCLAKAVSAAGARVALLDADLDNPQLAAGLGIQPSCGWEDVLRGELPLEEAAIYSHGDRITLIPLANDEEKRNFALSDSRVTKLVQQLKAHFDLVIVDMGPVGSAERRLFAGGAGCPVDAALVVRDARLTTSDDVTTSASRLKANGIRSVGIIENFV